jgi:hypothetical protein
MCLYPGVYSPPLPIYAAPTSVYLANQSPPSYSYSGKLMHENAYIMNLQSCGGYIDGCALKSHYLANPSACGHLVNHDAVNSNVEVFSFRWDEVMQHRDDDDEEEAKDHFSIPNETRRDGSPWYFDEFLQELVRFPSPIDRVDANSSTCGAALVLTTPVSEGEELFLDYKLKEPLPEWARDWYNQ